MTLKLPWARPATPRSDPHAPCPATNPERPQPDRFAHARPFPDLYTIPDRRTRMPRRLLFARMPEIFADCARYEPRPGDERGKAGTLDMTLVMPSSAPPGCEGVFTRSLPTLALRTYRMCEGENLAFDCRSRGADELDVHRLRRTLDAPVVQPHHVHDVARWFPGVALDVAVARMRATQRELLAQAEDRLATHNLILVGNPSVNPVWAHLCNRILSNGASLAELGLYEYPATGPRGPLELRRARPLPNGDVVWDDFRDRHWAHRDVGWVQMLRNPWSTDDRPRFVVLYGGFNPQGVLAAMRKRLQIGNTLLSLVGGGDRLPADVATARLLACRDPNEATDFRYRPGTGEECFIPAHVVRARVEPTLDSLLNAPRPDADALTWTATAPWFSGNVADFDPVVGPIE